MTSSNPLSYTRLVFSDDFDGTVLDTGKWKATTANDAAGYGQETWDAGHAKLDGASHLVLTATLDPVTGVVLAGEVRSVIISTPQMIYGYYNFRLKLVGSHPGAWPGGWLLSIYANTAQQSRKEIDVVECNSAKPSYIGENLHAESQWVSNGSWADPSGLDYSLDFHDYGVDYTSDHIDFYVDGILRRHYAQVASPNFNEPMQLRVSLSVFGAGQAAWAAAPDVTTVWPMVLLCDSVQFWEAGATLVDTISPAVGILSPLNGALISRRGQVSVLASASDNVGVSKVELYVNNVLVGTDTAAPFAFTFTTSGKPRTTYKIDVRAYDAAGNSAQASVSVKTGS